MLPNSAWKWTINEGRLSLDMGKGQSCDMLFVPKCLRCVGVDKAFTLEHTDTYYTAIERLETSPVALSDAQRLHIALHATAAIHFHKPVAIKSWWFDEGDGSTTVSHFSVLCSQTHQGLALTLERGESASLVMLLSNGFIANTQKSLAPFTVMKVCNTKLTSADSLPTQQKRA